MVSTTWTMHTWKSNVHKSNEMLIKQNEISISEFVFQNHPPNTRFGIRKFLWNKCVHIDGHGYDDTPV